MEAVGSQTDTPAPWAGVPVLDAGVLGTLAHGVGWPFPRGGAQALTDALACAEEVVRGAVDARGGATPVL